MTTGMSAPPIGSTSEDAEDRRGDEQQHDDQDLGVEPATIATPERDRDAEQADVARAGCGGPIVTGLPSISSCSLANATFEPQKETEPTIAAKTS